MKKKKILITGSNGFLGMNLFKKLRKKYNVYGIGRKKENKKNYFILDLKNYKKVEYFFKKNSFDLIIHCAWYTKHSDYRKSKKNYNYLGYSKNLLDYYIKSGGKNFIGIGTCEEYLKEDNKKNVFVENKNIKPINIYSKTKNYFHLYLKKKKINYKWIRIFYLFGEGENKKRLLPSLIESVKSDKKFNLKNPKFKTDFLHVDTVVKTIDKLINLKVSGEFNVCRGKSERLEDIFRIIHKYFKKNFKEYVNKNRAKIDNEEIIGSTKKIRKYKCFVRSNFKQDVIKYIQSFENSRPQI